MTPLKLMKLVYFSYAWFLHLTDEDLFDEEIQAWKHCPVIPSLYHEFKHFGLYGNIRGQYATYIDLTQDNTTPILQIPIVEDNALNNDNNLNKAICGVWFYYRDRSGDDLEQISHGSGSVWSSCYKISENIVINKDEVKKKLIKERAEIGCQKAMELNK